MDEIASTKAQANDHLRKLREERGIRGEDNNISDSVVMSSLDEALKLLSDQLYTTPTHFLLELIQNADDNTYPCGTVPRLHLSLYKKEGDMFFRSDCNEIGFTFKQLDALARIGNSTKKAITEGRKGYIGEKGIGFKSVFKVADVVHIASGHYEFKLDRRETIGMMLPILSRFPSDDRIEDHTQVLLKIKSKDSYNKVKRELQVIEPQILLFIRKLKQLDVSIDGHNRAYRQTKRTEDCFGGETNTISETTEDVTEKNKYIIHRRTVKNLPQDPRREGVNTSEVVLAFAVKDKARPITKPQHVFAFLPIHCYGFPFLIHADFLLIASRESLEYHCTWNLALQKGIKDAVVAAVSRFVCLDETDDDVGLCYSWPKYLARQRESLPFWNKLHDDILDALRSKSILESRDEDAGFQTPTALHYVPASYRFEGSTLFDLPSINATHLAFAYDEVYTHLTSIGLSTLSVSDLCAEFCQWVSAVGVAGLKEQSNEWHCKVSRVFYGKGETVLERLRKLPIIPLRDGSWVKATESHLYLPSQNKNEHVPRGVNISIVGQDASQDQSRREFYKYLGIQEYNPRQVCKLILEIHRELAAKWTGRSKQELVDDAVYLFKHRYQLPNVRKPPDIFFAVKQDGKINKRRQSRIYLVDPSLEYGVIVKYKSTTGNPFTLLSDAYEAAIRKDDPTSLGEFRAWLLWETSIFATTPDLVRNSSLTPEWKFLRDQNVLDLLYAVRQTLLNSMYPPPKLIEAVPRLEVRCLDGTSNALNGLAVPTPDLKRACPHLDFADLPEPTYENWNFLSQFGVITELGTTAILRELGALRQVPAEDVDAIKVRSFYVALASNAIRNKYEIMTAFLNQPLIFIPKPSPGRWLSREKCVWTAPRLLTRITKLKSYYPECESLFCSLLGVQAARMQNVVDEFHVPITGEDREIQQRLEGLMLLLEKFHNKSRLTDEQILRVRSAKVFPILGPPSGEQPVQIEMRSMEVMDWYIPDSVTFEFAFQGKIDMLSLPVQSVRRLKNIFEVLWCDKELLSVSVNQEVTPNGMAIRNMPEEQDLRERLKYIARLIEDRDGTPLDFPSLRISSVPSITVTMSIGDVEVTVDDKLVTIDDSEDTIDIYLREGIDQAHRPLVTFEYVEYFKKKMKFNEDVTSLINLLMSAPIESLSRILQEHDIVVPPASDENDENSSSDDADSSDNDQTLVDKEAATSNDDCDSRFDNHAGSLGGQHRRRAASAPADSDTEQGSRSSSAPMRRNHHSTPLRELIPSHQSRTESIIQRASAFRISDAATAPIQYHSESRAMAQFSLPIRTRILDNPIVETAGQVEIPFVAATHGITGGAEARGYHTSSTSRRRRSFRTRATQRPDDTTEMRTREIGFLGELFMYEIFAQQINDWTFMHWTSRLRREAGHPLFRGLERDFSDLTYTDTTGRMRTVLRDAGVEPNPAWSNTTTFHLEVKGTMGPCAEPMFVPQNQVDKMRLFDNKPNDACILVRVFNLEEGRDTGVKFFRDPWSLYMAGVLKFRADDGYRVFQLRPSNASAL